MSTISLSGDPPLAFCGPRVADYHLCLPALGNGAFGKVYAAQNIHDFAFCALKVLASGKEEVERQALARYRAEFPDRPHLLPIHHVGATEEGLLYYTMPLADDLKGPTALRPFSQFEAATLEAYRDRFRMLEFDTILQITEHLLCGVVDLHEQGLVHRDLKPANILRWHGRWCIGDVGLVAAGEELRGEICGTPEWRDPSGTRDPRADLYALGMILYVLVVGCQRPLASAALLESRLASLNAPANSRERQFHDIILRACKVSAPFRTAVEMRRAVRGMSARIQVVIKLDEDFAGFDTREEMLVALLGKLGIDSPIVSKRPGCVELVMVPTLGELDLMRAGIERGELAPFKVLTISPATPAPSLPASYRRAEFALISAHGAIGDGLIRRPASDLPVSSDSGFFLKPESVVELAGTDLLHILPAGEEKRVQVTRPIWFTHLLEAPVKLEWPRARDVDSWQVLIYSGAGKHADVAAKDAEFALDKPMQAGLPRETDVRWEVRARSDSARSAARVRGIFQILSPTAADVLRGRIDGLLTRPPDAKRELELLTVLLSADLYDAALQHLTTMLETYPSASMGFAICRALATVYREIFLELTGDRQLGDPEGLWAGALNRRYLELAYNLLKQPRTRPDLEA